MFRQAPQPRQITARPSSARPPTAASHRGARQPGDDVAGAAARGVAAQKKSLIAAARDEAARLAWRDEAAGLNPADLIVVDETSTHPATPRRRARAPRGARAVGRVPRNHGPNVTLLAARTPAGIGPTLAITGAVDGAVFATSAARLLAPSVRPGQVVVLDNRSAPKSEAARTAVAAAGGLPPLLAGLRAGLHPHCAGLRHGQSAPAGCRRAHPRPPVCGHRRYRRRLRGRCPRLLRPLRLPPPSQLI